MYKFLIYNYLIIVQTKSELFVLYSYLNDSIGSLSEARLAGE